MTLMMVEVWSDVVCPWCYIGKRNLETAISQFEHGDQVEVHWRSFQLDPHAPKEGTRDLAGALATKYGTDRAGALQMMDRVTAVAESVGLEYHFDRAIRANTLDAHRLLHLAWEAGGAHRQGELKEALLRAHFTEGLDIADHDALVGIATGAGLGDTEVRELLASDRFADAVHLDVAEAHDFGLGGVPFFLVPGAGGVAGAQAPERLLTMLEKAWHKTTGS